MLILQASTIDVNVPTSLLALGTESTFALLVLSVYQQSFCYTAFLQILSAQIQVSKTPFPHPTQWGFSYNMMGGGGGIVEKPEP